MTLKLKLIFIVMDFLTILAYPVAFVGFTGALPSAEFWARGIVACPWTRAIDRELIDITYNLRILPWYALPTLPFAVWIWRKDRHKMRERIELALPASAFLVLLLATSFFREARDAHAMVLLLPLALAAASAMDRLPRGLARFIDSLSLLFCGLIIVSAWFY